MSVLLVASAGGLFVVVVAARRPVRSLDRTGSVAPWRRLATRRRPGGGAPVEDLRLLRSAVASGASLVHALDVVVASGGPWALPVREVVRHLRAGSDLVSALEGWAEADGGPAVGAAVDALIVTATTGGQVVGALDAVLATVEEREALGREVEALASQAKASAAVVVVLPFVFAVGVAVLDPRVWAFYVGSFAGGLCLFAGASLDLVGAWWMRHIVRSV